MSERACETTEMAKRRLQVTVRDDLVKWMDQEIDKARFGSRSHAIEYALTQLKETKLRRLQKHERE